MLDELVQEFNQLSEEEQRSFLTRIMPAVRILFLNDPSMIEEIMPFCQEMMSKLGCDMSGMMEMPCSSVKTVSSTKKTSLET